MPYIDGQGNVHVRNIWNATTIPVPRTRYLIDKQNRPATRTRLTDEKEKRLYAAPGGVNVPLLSRRWTVFVHFRLNIPSNIDCKPCGSVICLCGSFPETLRDRQRLRARERAGRPRVWRSHSESTHARKGVVKNKYY